MCTQGPPAATPQTAPSLSNNTRRPGHADTSEGSAQLEREHRSGLLFSVVHSLAALLAAQLFRFAPTRSMPPGAPCRALRRLGSTYGRLMRVMKLTVGGNSG